MAVIAPCTANTFSKHIAACATAKSGETCVTETLACTANTACATILATAAAAKDGELLVAPTAAATCVANTLCNAIAVYKSGVVMQHLHASRRVPPSRRHVMKPTIWLPGAH